MSIPFVSGLKRAKDAKNMMEKINLRHVCNINKLTSLKENTYKKMDEIGGKELLILQSLKEFVDSVELLEDKPEFKGYKENGMDISVYTMKNVKRISNGASILLNAMTGAKEGALGDFAATGAVTAVIKSLEMAKDENPMKNLNDLSLKSNELINLAAGINKDEILSKITTALWGTAIAGSAILGGPFLGIGLLSGNVACDIYGNSFSQKAEEAERKMLKEEREINETCEYLEELMKSGKQFNDALIVASASYKRQLEKLKRIIIEKKKRKLGDFSEEEKKIFENINALAGILIKMCDIKLVFKDEVTDCELVNVYAVEKNVQEARNFLSSNNLYI